MAGNVLISLLRMSNNFYGSLQNTILYSVSPLNYWSLFWLSITCRGLWYAVAGGRLIRGQLDLKY